jgi:Sulfite exporter TauE/SafE
MVSVYSIPPRVCGAHDRTPVLRHRWLVTFSLLALPLGLLIGVSLGALGGGGSILTVPALVYVIGENPRNATSASLLIVGVTALTGTIGYARSRRVRWGPGLVFGVVGWRITARVGPQQVGQPECSVARFRRPHAPGRRSHAAAVSATEFPAPIRPPGGRRRTDRQTARRGRHRRSTWSGRASGRDASPP